MGIGLVALAFVAGVLTVLSPCVLPILPIVLGAAASERKYGPAALAAGLALSFVVVGLLVSTIGFSIGLNAELFRGAAVGRERRLVDYYEGSGVGLDHYAQVLHDKRIQHGWKYGDHYFPHDVKVKELSSGTSRVQSLAALGIEATPVPQSNVLDGINVTRRMLGRSWIDSDRCERGIEALRQYRREYDDKLKD